MEAPPRAEGELTCEWVFWVGITPFPPKVAYLRSQVAMLLVFLVASSYVAQREWISLWPREMPEPKLFVMGAAVLVALLTLMRPMWRSRVESRSRTVWLFMPRTPAERFWWIATSIAVGVSEEVTYRGVMFALLWRLTENAMAAALIGAAIFAISHFMQGAKNMAIIFGIAVHALYDVAAGLFYGYFGEKLGYPIEPMPA